MAIKCLFLLRFLLQGNMWMKNFNYLNWIQQCNDEKYLQCSSCAILQNLLRLSVLFGVLLLLFKHFPHVTLGINYGFHIPLLLFTMKELRNNDHLSFITYRSHFDRNTPTNRTEFTNDPLWNDYKYLHLKKQNSWTSGHS